jgi:phage host-nuclease inhibitor protein Gam
MEIREQIDELLHTYKIKQKELEDENKKAQAQLDKIRQTYKLRLERLERELQDLDKSIKQNLKTNKKELFKNGDMVELENGLVYHRENMVVHRARGILAKLEELKLDDAIKITKSVKWDVIEKWPDEKLSEIGTKRKLKESFEYELR